MSEPRCSSLPARSASGVRCNTTWVASPPLRAPVAGVAMGLIMDESTGKFAVLTDIAGAEDHYGDMDFKVAGTAQGITALQMDIKVTGITSEIMREALEQARVTLEQLKATYQLKRQAAEADLRILQIRRDRAAQAERQAAGNAERMAIHAPIALAATYYSKAPNSDFDNFYNIGTRPGRPWVDFPVEFPVATTQTFRALAPLSGDRERFGVNLVVVSFVADLAIAGALAWAWGIEAAACYAFVMIPLLDLFLLRSDLWSTALATAAAAAWRRELRAFAAIGFGLGAAFKRIARRDGALAVAAAPSQQQPREHRHVVEGPDGVAAARAVRRGRRQVLAARQPPDDDVEEGAEDGPEDGCERDGHR